MGTARNDLAELAQARSNVYGLLAAVFRAEPDVDLLARLRAPDVARTLEGVGLDLQECLPDLPDGQLAEDLAVEYTRLFVGPGPRISLYESVHADTGDRSEASLWTARTARVKAFIETAGLAYADDFTDLPDHVGAELEFMHRLAEQEAEDRRADRAKHADALLAVQEKFFREHLGQWLSGFCDKVIARAELPFYRRMAELAKEVAEFERGTMLDGASPGPMDAAERPGEKGDGVQAGSAG